MRFGDREYKTPAHLGKEAVAGVKSPYLCGFRDFEKALNVYSLLQLTFSLCRSFVLHFFLFIKKLQYDFVKAFAVFRGIW